MYLNNVIEIVTEGWKGPLDHHLYHKPSRITEVPYNKCKDSSYNKIF